LLFLNAMIIYSLLTHRGMIRIENEDNSGIYQISNIFHEMVFAIADGLGGLADGEVASQMAVEGMGKWVQGIEGVVDKADLKVAFGRVNDEIYGVNQQRKPHELMATTLTVSAFIKDKLIIGHVGDCRVYRVRGDDIVCLTTDHTRSRHVLIRTIGAEEHVEVDIYEHEVLGGDIYVQCSDGLYPQLSQRELMLIAKNHAPEEACRKYVDLANERGGPDNITVQVIHCEA
jgi:PPM family protein phosphatase